MAHKITTQISRNNDIQTTKNLKKVKRTVSLCETFSLCSRHNEYKVCMDNFRY